MKEALLIFNPDCSKCRGADEILRDLKIEFKPIYYLKGELTKELLVQLPGLLNLSYAEMIRVKDDLFQELKLADVNLKNDEWIRLILNYPALLERPIFVYENRAVIARPSELVKSII